MFERSPVTWWPRAAGFWFALAAICGGCAAHSSGEPGEVEGPAFKDLFQSVVTDCWDKGLDLMTGAPSKCTQVFFDIEVLERWCVVPDADSFDDYTDYRLTSDGRLFIDPGTQLPVVTVPRGKTPAPGAEMCDADGVVTGPENEAGEYYPSKFCRVSDCTPAPP
jgi:hypothetical protein